MTTMQPKWVARIREECEIKKTDPATELAKHRAVLKWKPCMLDCPRLDPTKVGVGPKHFVELIEKLCSVRVNPPKKEDGPKGKTKTAASATDAAAPTKGKRKSDAMPWCPRPMRDPRRPLSKPRYSRSGQVPPPTVHQDGYLFAAVMLI